MIPLLNFSGRYELAHNVTHFSAEGGVQRGAVTRLGHHSTYTAAPGWEPRVA